MKNDGRIIGIVEAQKVVEGEFWKIGTPKMFISVLKLRLTSLNTRVEWAQNNFLSDIFRSYKYFGTFQTLLIVSDESGEILCYLSLLKISITL